MVSTTHDTAIIGGGILGLATALALTELHPGRSVVILEKERRLAAHQTGHNSGVIHAGIYYKPGSYKAKLCVEGVRRLTEFCDAHGIRYERCGKVILATDHAEVPRLQALYERGTTNGIPGLEIIAPERLREIEPHARAVSALYSRQTAIVDFTEVARVMAAQLAACGVEIRTGARVRTLHRSNGTWCLRTTVGDTLARHLVNCGGLYADVLARLMGARPEVQIIPFRGESSVRNSNWCGRSFTPCRIQAFLSWGCTLRSASRVESRPDRTRCWPLLAKGIIGGL
jgi:L-2-hydroxyglutarate oxidase